jgi:hypothetical protein
LGIFFRLSSVFFLWLLKKRMQWFKDEAQPKSSLRMIDLINYFVLNSWGLSMKWICFVSGFN